MAEIIIMPKLGFNMDEGKLVEWYKNEGDAVKKGEPLFSVETDKTNMDIEATGDGIVSALLIQAGDKIPVTLPIAVIGAEGEDVSQAIKDAKAQLAAGGGAPAEEAAPAEAKQAAAEPAEKAAKAEASASPKAGDGRLLISPRARRVAKENDLCLDSIDIVGTGWGGGICEADILAYLASNKVKITPVAKAMADAEGIDISAVRGTGANGKIMKADIEAALKAKQAVPAAAEVSADAKFSPDGKEILEEVPYAGVRKVIGDRLAESKFTAPHLYFTQKVDLSKLLEVRKQVNEAQEKKTSVTDYIARAAVMALQKYPDMNASLIGDTIVKYKSVNLGIAVASPTGLIVPNIKEAQKLSVVELSKASTPLFDKARAGKLAYDEYNGGTFTISNLGMFGIENFTAIINPPEVGILAISSTKDEPVVITKEDGTKDIAIRPMMNIQLTVDHRLIDGLLAAQFVTEIKNLLETPISLLV